MNAEPLITVVDDDPAVRHSLTRLLESAGYACCAYASAEAFLADYNPDVPGCLLLDVRMPGMSGIELQARLAEQTVRLPVIIVTGHGDIPMAVSAMKTGVFDFIEKPFDDDRILDCIKRALAHDTRVRCRQCERRESQRRLNLLSPRELEVLNGLAAGETVEQVASRLHISPKTVYMHRGHVMEKVGVDSIADLVKLKFQAQNPDASGV